MEISDSPEFLNNEWDKIADFCFQKREFLTLLHKYNPCSQRYYKLYKDGEFVAGTVVYTLKIDLLTFLNIPSPLTMHVIGLPASVATPPLIGDRSEFQFLLNHILKEVKGFILGLNMMEDYLDGKVMNMRTLPTFIFRRQFDNIEGYEQSLRHNYRRRFRNIRKKFRNVRSETSGCSAFTDDHYRLYLEIMKRTKTKLEILSPELFRNLSSSFTLTTYSINAKILCWHITCSDKNVLFFFFGGMDYSLRDQYQSYHNNLYGIIAEAIDGKYDCVDLGQTAETAKTRLGGIPEERRMFFYHRNPVIYNLLRPFKRVLTYPVICEKSNVFKIYN